MRIANIVTYHGWIKLPEKKTFVKKLTPAYRALENYGSLSVAADYCSIPEPVKPVFAIWLHGAQTPWVIESSQRIVYHSPLAKKIPLYLATKKQEKHLKDDGYFNAKAIGLPFIYLPDLDVQRKKNTLLVMPVHSLVGKNTFQVESELEEYANYINAIKHKFNEVIVCVHSSCVVNGYWVKQFNRLNIRWITGADSHDKNALLRIKMLMSQFEFVTSNGWGSHIAYALATGAKVSICGPVANYNVDALMKDPGWGKDRELAAMFLSDNAQKMKDNALKNLYVSPECGKQDTQMGASFIGLENKISPQEMVELFNWTYRERLLYLISPKFLFQIVTVALRSVSRLIKTLLMKLKTCAKSRKSLLNR